MSKGLERATVNSTQEVNPVNAHALLCGDSRGSGKILVNVWIAGMRGGLESA